MSKTGSVNKNFISIIKPELLSWGLSTHPNQVPGSNWHGNGYTHDFADIGTSETRIVSFSIFSYHTSIVIYGLRMKSPARNDEIPFLYGNTPGVFTLTKSWSIRSPFRFYFAYKQYKGETEDQAAARLINEIMHDIPKLHKYLYG
jgi:hypothetical protein